MHREARLSIPLLTRSPQCINRLHLILKNVIMYNSPSGNGVDFVSDPVNATFLPNQQAATVTIPIVADDEMEDTEYFGIRFQPPESPARLGGMVVSFQSGDIMLTVGIISDGSSM